LVVGRVNEPENERDWPGRVFEREDLSYAEAMDRFIAARQTKDVLGQTDSVGAPATDGRKEQRKGWPARVGACKWPATRSGCDGGSVIRHGRSS